MAQAIPESHVGLLKKPVFAHFVTLMKDGSPQSTPVWVEYDGKYVIVNSAIGRLKDKNVRRDPRVALSITDPENNYRYLEIRGRVVEITQEGADEGINMLAKKYLGKDVYPFRQPGEQRVIFKISPDKVVAYGG